MFITTVMKPVLLDAKLPVHFVKLMLINFRAKFSVYILVGDLQMFVRPNF